MGNTEKFEMMADRYETPERVRFGEAAANAIRECLADAICKDAIDFGCGTGLVGMNLLNDFGSVLFLDTSKNMIDQVKQKISNSDVKNADTLCFDFEKGSPPDLHADYVFMVQVLLHIKDYEPVLSKLYDVLNPGGHLIIIDFDKNDQVASDLVHNGFDQERLKAEMSSIGYRNLQSKTFYKGSKIFMGCDASLFILDSQK